MDWIGKVNTTSNYYQAKLISEHLIENVALNFDNHFSSHYGVSVFHNLVYLVTVTSSITRIRSEI